MTSAANAAATTNPHVFPLLIGISSSPVRYL